MPENVTYGGNLHSERLRDVYFALLTPRLFLRFLRIAVRELRARAIGPHGRTFLFACRLGMRIAHNASLRQSIRDRSVQTAVYSFWAMGAAFALPWLPRARSVSVRVHGYDVYEEVSGYLPFRRSLFQSVDRILAISDDARNNLQARYPEEGLGSKLIVSRLGTDDPRAQPRPRSDQQRTIVSCSALIPLKRVDRIVDALSKMVLIGPVRWVHFGGGPLAESIRRRTERVEGGNILFDLRGVLPNQEILDFYRDNRVDVFLNVSSSEGVPVSVMEAMSFGIPIVATDVGGTKELFEHERTGELIAADFSDAELVASITKVLDEGGGAYDSRSAWEHRCNARENSRALAKLLIATLPDARKVSGARKTLWRILRLVPQSLLVRLAPQKIGIQSAAIPKPVVPSLTSVRLYIAPANFGGQAWGWARAIERHIENVSAVCMAPNSSGGFAFNTDYSVPAKIFHEYRPWQRAQFRNVSELFTHALVEAELAPFGGLFGASVVKQIDGLVSKGVKVAMLCHGTDIRVPSRHAQLEPESPFGAVTDLYLDAQARRNRDLLDALGLPVFVSTPDLVLDVPHATWLPVVADLPRFTVTLPPLQRRLPVVVHVPTDERFKRSDLIDPVLWRLHAEGVIEYRRLTGIPSAEMPDVFRAADVVVDQLGMGIYGVAACEAMAAGRVVVAHVSQYVRHYVKRETSLELPILEVTSTTLESQILSIANERERYISAARHGPEFVRAVHDGTRSAQALHGFLS
ncbi:MAG: glycosyltransferase [Terrimesophilobacter sp.]